MKKFALLSLCGAALFTACSDSSSLKVSLEELDILESSSSISEDESSSSEVSSSSEASGSKESSSSAKSEPTSSSSTDKPSSSATDKPSSSANETSSSSAEISSSAEPKSSATSSSSAESSSSFVSRDINVGVYQYEMSGLDFLNANIYNNETQAIDSLTLRLYVTTKPENIEITPVVDQTPGTCPLVVDEDICIMYDSRGYSTPCILPDGTSADRELRTNLRHSTPIRIDNSYNALTGEYTYYIPIPLGSIELSPSTHMRIDIGFTSGIFQNHTCETLRTPTKKKLSKDSSGWSWVAHQKDVDGADYEGIPLLDRDYGDTAKAPINPYIAIYRRDELISGIPPKY